MKKIISIVSMLAVLFCLNGCTNTVPQMPSSFNFAINFGYGNATNRIDTFNNTFTKDLITAGTETIELVISEEKMQEFYEVFLENNIPNLPEKVVSRIDGSVATPSSKVILTYTENGKTKTIACDDVGGGAESTYYTEDYNRLVRFVTVVLDYVSNTDGVQNMPEPQGGYL